MARVSVIQTKEREAGVRGAIAALGQNPVKNKSVLIKPDFNTPFSPDLIVMDGIDTFVDGGPATGKRVKGNMDKD